MPATLVNIQREIDETHALILRATITGEHLESIGYPGAEEAVTALRSSTIVLVVPTLAVQVTATVAADQVGNDVRLRMAFALPTAITDTAHVRQYHVVFEPGSTTAERTLCQGTITITARAA
jgi:hypothetical protein